MPACESRLIQSAHIQLPKKRLRGGNPNSTVPWMVHFMNTNSAKPAQVILLVSLILVVLLAYAWNARLFGLGVERQTLIVPSMGGIPDGADGSISRELEIVTLLGYDAIPAIFDPLFISAAEASDPDRRSALYRPDEKILGIEINGDTRAYSVPMLSRHEVVNDTVGGIPVAVTW